LTDFQGAAVRDNNTGLVWEKSPLETTSDWSGARMQCAEKNVGGTRGWRLPSVVELSSLIDPSLTPPYVQTSVFPTVKVNPYWSETANGDSTSPYGSSKLTVNFGDGLTGLTSKGSQSQVWCVRGPMSDSVY
jgi:hypothetical protein